MKIFNWPWVRGNCHHKATEDSEKLASTEKEYRCLVEDVSFNVGVLAIGTFGFDCHPFAQLNQEQCGDYISINDDDDDNDDLEAKPLLIVSKPITCLDFDELPDHPCDEIKAEKRITLADLLSADSNDDVVITAKIKNNDDDYHRNKIENVDKENEEESGKKRKLYSLRIMKKLIQDQLKAKDKKKVQHKAMKLMTRMMKRKIHPDNESDTDGNSNAIIAPCSS